MKMVLSLLLLATAYVVMAQEFAVPNKKNALLLKNRKLAIVLRTGTDKRDAKMLEHEPNPPKEYKPQWDQFNANIEAVVRKEWTYSSSIEVISEEAAQKLKESRDQNYALLELTFYSAKVSNPTTKYDGIVQMLSVSLAQDPKDAVVGIMLTLQKLTPGKLTLLIRQCQVQLEDCINKDIKYFPARSKEIATHNGELKGKTIVICKTDASEKLVNTIEKNSWKEKLAFQVRVVDEVEFEKTLLSQDKNTIVVVPIAMGAAFCHYCFMAPSDGRIIYLKPMDGDSGFTVEEKMLLHASEALQKSK